MSMASNFRLANSKMLLQNPKRVVIQKIKLTIKNIAFSLGPRQANLCL